MSRPLVSVLLPTRDRAQLAKESIDSLGNGNFEILLWVDEDDPQIDEYKNLPHKVYIRPRVGYKRFHEMINFLASKAHGEWMMLWNDDALMDTPEWCDVIKAKAEPGLTVLNIAAPGVDNNNLFPVIHRDLYETLGHWSLNAHCDSWVQDLANELNIHQLLNGVSATHRRSQVFDQTKNESQGAYSETSPQYSSEPIQKLWRQDVEKVRSKLNG